MLVFWSFIWVWWQYLEQAVLRQVMIFRKYLSRPWQRMDVGGEIVASLMKARVNHLKGRPRRKEKLSLKARVRQ